MAFTAKKGKEKRKKELKLFLKNTGFRLSPE